MKRTLLVLTASLAVMTAGGASAALVSQDNFLLKTTSDLVNLCGADQRDPLYTAAINFCHGFGVGTFRMVQIEEAASRTKRKQVCVENEPGTTRDSAIAAFVSWAADKPKVLATTPSDGFVEYLITKFPCKK